MTSNVHWSTTRILLLVLVDVPLLIEIDELDQQLVKCIPRFYFDVHGGKKGQKEEHSARQGHQFGLSQLGAVGIDSLDAILLEAKHGDDGTGNHDGKRKEEKQMQKFVPARTVRKLPVADL